MMDLENAHPPSSERLREVLPACGAHAFGQGHRLIAESAASPAPSNSVLDRSAFALAEIKRSGSRCRRCSEELCEGGCEMRGHRRTPSGQSRPPPRAKPTTEGLQRNHLGKHANPSDASHVVPAPRSAVLPLGERECRSDRNHSRIWQFEVEGNMV